MLQIRKGAAVSIIAMGALGSFAVPHVASSQTVQPPQNTSSSETSDKDPIKMLVKFLTQDARDHHNHDQQSVAGDDNHSGSDHAQSGSSGEHDSEHDGGDHGGSGGGGGHSGGDD